MNDFTWTTTGGDRVTVFPTDDGQFAWHCKARNGEIVGQGESHPRQETAIAAALRHHPRLPAPEA